MDAISFLAFGVFTSAVSGSTVVLGIAIAQQAWQWGANAGAAFVAYFLGAAASSCLTPDGAPVHRTLRLQLGAQVVLLAALCILWMSHEPTLRQHPGVRFALIILAGLAMGAQATTAQSLRVSGIITVVFTGTLTAIAKAVAERVRGRIQAFSTDTKRQIVSWTFYCAGAILAALLQKWSAIGTLVPLATSGAALVGAIGYAKSGGGSQST